MTPAEKRQAALDQIKAVYDDGEAEVNGRKYRLLKMQHVERRKVFAFYTSVQNQLQQGNFLFLDSPAFAAVEEVMWKNVSFDGALIAKLRDHWEEYPEDYMTLVSTVMGVMSYPFIRAASIVSTSQDDLPRTTTSEKPM